MTRLSPQVDDKLRPTLERQKEVKRETFSIHPGAQILMLFDNRTKMIAHYILSAIAINDY